MGGLTDRGHSLDHEDALTLLPRKQYEPILKDSVKALALGLDFDGDRLIDYLYSKEDQEWIKNQFTSHLTPERQPDGQPLTKKAS